MSKELVRLWQRPSKDGRSFKYYLIFTDHDGKRKQKSLGHANKRKAQTQRAELEKDLQLGNSTLNSMRLSEMLTDYLHRTRKQIEPSTAKSAEYRMKDFIAAVGDISAEKITYQYCEKLVHFCIDKGLSPASINTHIKMLKRIFSLAVKRGQLEKNPFGGFPLMRVARKNVRVLTDNETQRLLRVTKPTDLWQARILLAKTAGLRRGEILNLTTNDIDYDKNKIIVQPKSDSKYTWRWVVKDKEIRELPMIEKVAKLLTNVQANLTDGQPYLLISPERYRNVVMLKRSGKLSDRIAKCPDSNFRRNWVNICKKACVENATFHDLRATCITEWLEQGMMPHEVQRLAGHSSVDTTMNYYVGIRESMIDRARQASTAALNADSVAMLLQRPKNAPESKEKEIASAMQTLIKAGLIKIGATGLEPATS